MPHVMIDLETLSTSPLAAFTQIGAVTFDPNGDGTEETFETHVAIETCIRAQMKLDGPTITWWMGQNQEAKDAFIQGQKMAEDVREALTNLKKWIRQASPSGVWSHGASFDITILECAFRRILGEPAPWKYTNARDTRTLFALTGKRLDQIIKSDRTGTYHRALDDAKTQALAVQVALKELKLRI